VEALFERIDVLGISSVEITPTPEADACGWSDAFGEPVALSVKVKTGRGERDSASLTQQSLRFMMINRTPRESFPARARSA
jgi:hypothetical protein